MARSAAAALLLTFLAACGGTSKTPGGDAADAGMDGLADGQTGDASWLDADGADAADASTDVEADPTPADAAGDTPADVPLDAADASDAHDAVDVATDAGRHDVLDASDTDPDEGIDTDAVIDADAGDVDLCPDGGCVDAGPFDDLLALEGVVLLEALAARIDDHTVLGYTAARDAMYADLDVNEGMVECIYTGTAVAADGTRTPGGVINTEHAWPRSQGADRDPALSDLHHLFPVTSRSNNARSDFYYGETACDQTAACAWFEGGSERGPSVVDGTTIFEVRLAFRGDVARAQFYFAVRYGLTIPAATELALRSWHDEDPPDARERTRHEGVAALQGNRNPFIDHPGLVWQIDDF